MATTIVEFFSLFEKENLDDFVNLPFLPSSDLP